MAHHASTPPSVLDAPNPAAVLISDQSGYSRAERRRAIRYVDKADGVAQVRVGFTVRFVPKPQQLPATNTPFRGNAHEAAAQRVEFSAENLRSRAVKRVKSLMTFGAGRKDGAR